MRQYVVLSTRSGNRGGSPGREYLVTWLDADGSPLLDADTGKPIQHPWALVRDPGHFGPDDPGDPGVGSTIHRCAFWVPAPKAKRRPIKATLRVVERDDLGAPLGLDASGRPFMVDIPNPWKSEVADVTTEELAALMSGEYREIVDDEAGGQISDLCTADEVTAQLMAAWQRYADAV